MAFLVSLLLFQLWVAGVGYELAALVSRQSVMLLCCCLWATSILCLLFDTVCMEYKSIVYSCVLYCGGILLSCSPVCLLLSALEFCLVYLSLCLLLSALEFCLVYLSLCLAYVSLSVVSSSEALFHSLCLCLSLVDCVFGSILYCSYVSLSGMVHVLHVSALYVCCKSCI